MKKIFVLFLILFNLIILAGCMDNEENSQILESGKFNQILNEYKAMEYLTIVEETNGITTDGDKVTAEKTTKVDKASQYTYSKISCGSKEGYVYQEDNSFYTKMDTVEDKKSIADTNDVFRSLGFSALFTAKDFTFTDNLAKKNIVSPEIENYKLLFDNVNFDLDRKDSYNPSILKVLIEVKDNKIQKIEFDLSLIYASFFQSLTRTVTFEYKEFTKEEIISFKENTKYEVATADTLDTYVIEMIYEFGDAIYIKSGAFDMLIDCGQYPDGENVHKMLKEYCTDNVLDVLIATHGHADHLGGFGNKALNSIEHVNLIIDFGYADDNCYDYRQVREQFITKGADYYTASECVKHQNGAAKVYRFSEDLSLEILDTGQYATNKGGRLTSSQYGAENDFSVVVKLTFGTNTYLYTGDLAGQLNDVFTSKLKQEDVKDITVYKAAHHGATSYNSNNVELLNYLNPKICVSSAAILDLERPYDHTNLQTGSTDYQHPRPAFVRRILNTPTIQKTKQYYFNGTMGTIHISDNGVDLPNVTGFGATRGYMMKNERVTGEDNLRFIDTEMYKSYYLS